jgi:hypothetical protein
MKQRLFAAARRPGGLALDDAVTRAASFFPPRNSFPDQYLPARSLAAAPATAISVPIFFSEDNPMSAPAPARARLLKRPVSDAQREAARRNGRLTRGPVSAGGKRRSSANARIHGLYAKLHVLSKDDLARFHEKCRAYAHSSPPANPEQASLLTRLAYAATRLESLAAFDTALWNYYLAETPAGPHQAAQAFESMVDDRRLETLSRLEERCGALRATLARALAQKRTGEVADSTGLSRLHPTVGLEHLNISADD